ncbi:hypothetical protein DESA109040_20800 [Deinococcus saxicola]
MGVCSRRQSVHDESEKEKNRFRTWSVEIGAVPISTALQTESV